MITPADKLTGLVLNDRWNVGDSIKPKPDDTGGNFSVCYQCIDNNDGSKGFLKAMDYTSALLSPDPAKALQIQTSIYNFERDLLDRCKGMSRVVTALDHGSINLDPTAVGNVVEFIVFELAETTVRSEIVGAQRPPLAWCLRILHNTFSGVRQLHSKDISHQDIKPSNILQEKDGSAKVADLGRAVTPDTTVAYGEFQWPGARHYAPPEIAYNSIDPDFRNRRISSDLYLLGSFVVSVFTGKNINEWLVAELPPHLLPKFWGGSYTDPYSSALPYVTTAYETALSKIEQDIGVDPELMLEVVKLIRELCSPLPSKRGDPDTHRLAGPNGNKYALDRYLARIDRHIIAAGLYDRRNSNT